MKTPRFNQNGLPGLILVLVGVIALAAAQWWLWQFVHLSAERLHLKQTQASQLADITKRIATIDDVYQKQRSLLEQLSVSFPPLADTPQVIERLERLASDQGVTIVIRSIGEGQASAGKKGKAKLVPLPVVIRVTGSITRVLTYLEALEHVPELTAVESWSLGFEPSAATTPAPAPLYALDGKVIFYLQP